MSQPRIAGPQSHLEQGPAISSLAAEPRSTPILLLVFNRSQTTRLVMESLQSVRPTRLYVAADGPRLDRADDVEKCVQARRIATSVDWDCSVRTLLRDTNLGAGPGIAQAISWFFDNESEGIILEDDCVPSKSFYRFCTELLAYYRNNPRVMHISGDNFQYGRRRGSASYYFSKYTHSWGWATWRRAWAHYDFALIPAEDRNHIWDAQWTMTVERDRGLSIVPNVNMVTNVGFGEDATHTRAWARSAALPALEMEFPLKHPDSLSVNRAADEFTYYANFRGVPDLRLIFLYRAWDYVTFRVRKLIRLTLGALKMSAHPSQETERTRK